CGCDNNLRWLCEAATRRRSACRRDLPIKRKSPGKCRAIWRHAIYMWTSDPKGIRTPVTAVKGRCPGPLDDGAALQNARSAAQEKCGRICQGPGLRQIAAATAAISTTAI